MKKMFLLLMLLLGYSSYSYSDEYQQQYEVGSVGPNGGVVTSVVVDSALLDTTIEIIGDFEEITYTYEYTEIITEDVEQTSYTTTTIVTPVTTPNLITNDGDFNDNNIHIVTPNVTDYGMSGAEFTTGNQQMGGGSRIYEGELPPDNKEKIDYGVTVYSHQSNEYVPDCANPSYDCRDDFKITMNLYNQGILVETTTHSYTGIDWSGSRQFDYSADVSELTFDYGSMELFGIDRGFNSGYYGPGFSDAYVFLTYNIITEVINTIITNTQMETVKTTDVYVYDSIYHPPQIPEIQIETISATDFEISVIEVDNFGTETVEVFEIEIISAEAMEVEDVPVLDTQEPDSETVDIATVQAEENPAEERQGQLPEETETSEEVEVKEAVAEEKSSKPQSYNVALDSVKVALMVQTASASEFSSYQQQQVSDALFYNPMTLNGGQPTDNPLGRYMTGASDLLMEEMVDMQWQR